MRIKSVKSILGKDNYNSTITFMEKVSLDFSIDSTASAKAKGFLKILLSFEFYFILSIVVIIFEQVEILN